MTPTARLALIACMALSPLLVGTTAHAAPQKQRYERPVEADIWLKSGFGSSNGFWSGVEFAIPNGAKKATVTIVDDSGVPVAAVVRGAQPFMACSGASNSLALAPDATTLQLLPFFGLSDYCPTPASLPTGGTITVEFK